MSESKRVGRNRNVRRNYQIKKSPIECTIRTLEGEMNANLGDYIIKGINGELYPCKPDIFDKTYERCQQ